MIEDDKRFSPPHYEGDQDADRIASEGPPIRTRADDIGAGRRAPKEGSGVVVGSGASAGGTGGPSEDYDQDPVGGGGGDVMPRDRGQPVKAPGKGA